MGKRILLTTGVRWWNASAQYTVDLARALGERGHQVLLAAREGTPAATRALEAGLEVDRGFDFRSRAMARDVARMVRLLRRRPFDILNPHRGADQNILLLARLAIASRTPVLRTRVDVKQFHPNPVNRIIYSRLLQGVLTPGETTRQLLIKHYRLDASRVSAVHGGVDTRRFDPARRDASLRRALGIPDDHVAVGLVARLGRIKGHSVFFEAAARLVDERSSAPERRRVRWLAIGKETDFTIPQLQALASSLGAPPIIFTGHRGDIEAVMACLDVGVVASVASEAHCRVGLELLASGVPIVGTRVGVVPEIVEEDRTGYVVAPEDAAAMAGAIRRLLESNRRESMAKEARADALDRFTLHAWARRTEEAFERIV